MLAEWNVTSRRLPVITQQRLLLIFVFLLAATTHAFNMLAFPFYGNVEGTNLANAWSLFAEGTLSPYTYSYDNTTMGWVLLGLWSALGNLAPIAGSVIVSGRILMFITHLFTVLMLYRLARKLELRQTFAILAVIIFSLSPLAIVLQRRVLVENLMTLWLLIALYAVLGKDRTLGHYAISAGSLGMAFLTDTSAILFTPAILYIVLRRSHSWHKQFAIALWVGITLSLFLEFPLHAQLKSELFPSGVFLGGNHPHVSLVESQSTLLARVPIRDLLRSDSSFVHNFQIWIDSSEDSSDAVLIFAGLLSGALVLAASIRKERLRPLALAILFYMLYIVTADQVFDTDIIPLLPFLAISIAIVIQAVVAFVDNHPRTATARYGFYALAGIGLVVIFGLSYIRRTEIYTANQVDGQLAATTWLSQHVPFEAIVVTDNYAFVDLRQEIPNTHYYWVVDADPEVRNEVLEDNWCNIDYMLTTPQMLDDMERNQLFLIESAYRNSTLIRTYENNGWPIEIRQVNKRNCNIPFP